MPALGTPIPTGHIYIEVPFSEIRQQTPVFTNYASPEPYYSIEHYVKSRFIFNAYRIDLVNGTRVYRFPNISLNQFVKNPCNPTEYYIPVGCNKFVIQNTDPSLGKAIEFGWTPL